MEKQNVTLSLSKDLLKKAKIIAIKNNTSLSGLLRRYIAEIVKRDESYDLAKVRHRRILRKGFNLGLKDNISWKRGELHER